MAGRKPEIENVDILRVFVQVDDPVLGANEVADMIDMTRQGADYRLRELEEGGLVASKIVSRDRVWWLTDEGREYIQTVEDD